MSKKQLVVVLTEPADGLEEEYNRYYEDVHLDEVLETAGLKKAQRFKLGAEVGEACPLPYLAVYETEAEDSASVLKRLNETRSQRQQSDALNMRTGRMWVFEEVGPEHSA